MRVISWNLLRRVGASLRDVVGLVEENRPDLLLMQEATEHVTGLQAAVGGTCLRLPLPDRIYGLAAWSPHGLETAAPVRLPVSTVPGRVPPRMAQLVRLGGVTFANVHLSHGQFLNRWQLLHVVRALEGPAAVIGDYNAVGPIRLPGFRDVGPMQPTCLASNMIALRLDRCMVRGLACDARRVLGRGPSDHHPILLELGLAAEAAQPTPRQQPRLRLRGTRTGAVTTTRNRHARHPQAASSS